MQGYGWDRYDPRVGGIQTMHDAGNHIDITTSFVKIPNEGVRGGNWAVRVKGALREDAPAGSKTMLMFAISSESSGLQGLEVLGEEEELKDERGFPGDVTIKGENPKLGSYKVVVSKGKGAHPHNSHPCLEERPLDNTFVSSLRLAEDTLWKSKSKLFSS
jgi:mannosyl-oligosaccharide glucosidase